MTMPAAAFRRSVAIVMVMAVIGLAGAVRGEGQDVYAGQTLRIVVASTPGGALDLEARLLARHLARHIPGAPRVIVENQPGAGGLVAANLFARTVKPDGLRLGYFLLSAVASQLSGTETAPYDVRTFGFVASPRPDRPVCVLTKASGIASLDAWRASPRALTLGATGPGSIMETFPALLVSVIRLPMRVVGGYTGSTDVRLAMASGELDGVCMAWGAVKLAWPRREGVFLVVQGGTAPDPDLRDVPLSFELASTPDDRELLGPAVDAINAVSRFYALPPGTPADIRSGLQRAVMNTMRDPAYLDDARKMGVPMDPIDGDALKGHIERLYRLWPKIADRVMRALSR
jgi:tripartite-type tricarboxylate transporter receptor subunit TctC